MAPEMTPKGALKMVNTMRAQGVHGGANTVWGPRGGSIGPQRVRLVPTRFTGGGHRVRLVPKGAVLDTDAGVLYLSPTYTERHKTHRPTLAHIRAFKTQHDGDLP